VKAYVGRSQDAVAVFESEAIDMEISAAFLPSPGTPDHIVAAEWLGYRRVVLRRPAPDRGERLDAGVGHRGG
jgi:hypothetical protein